MELEGFVSRNFKPREDIEEKAVELIKNEIKDIPLDGQMKATIVHQGNSFSISIVAVANNKIFSSESHHQKHLFIGAPRFWQLDKLKIVLKDLIHQIKRQFNIRD